jgi:hypothetical protein
MDITKYRQHVVNSSYVGDIHFKNDLWEQVFLFVPLHLRLRYDGIHAYNHPLVNSGEAYWSNNTTLCLGYRLLNNPDVFRPIFSHKRQHNIDNFQRNIFSAAEMVVWRRGTFIELFKIKTLPEDIIKFILKY